MIDAARLLAGWALVWAFGIAIVAAIDYARRDQTVGSRMWTVGSGFFAGAFIVTAWMRALSVAGIRFSLLSIGLPVLIATAALGFLAFRRRAVERTYPAMTAFDASESKQPTSRPARLLLYALIVWLVLRFITLLLDVWWTPLYPWDAWIQWATKARVWYSLGHIVPFGRSAEWS